MASALFELLRPELEDWIGWYRVPSVGPLDIMATAERIGFSVVIAPEGTMLSNGQHVSMDGSYYPGELITVNSSMPGPKWRLIYGHEVGHYLLQQLGLTRAGLTDEQIENFCEWFGRELALPLAQVQPGVSLGSLCEAMKVDSGTAHYQLWRKGLGPTARRVDDDKYEKVHCTHHNGFDPVLFPEGQCDCSLLWWKARPHSRPPSQQLTIWSESVFERLDVLGMEMLYPDKDEIGTLEELQAKSSVAVALNDDIPF